MSHPGESAGQVAIPIEVQPGAELILEVQYTTRGEEILRMEVTGIKGISARGSAGMQLPGMWELIYSPELLLALTSFLDRAPEDTVAGAIFRDVEERKE